MVRQANQQSAFLSAAPLPPPAPGVGTAWPHFYEKMRMDIIEAQCALESGRAHRAIELMEEMLCDAASCDQLHLRGHWGTGTL